MASGVTNQPRPKSPVPDRYKSRLMLTYRTNITGTPIPQRLPFRVLVLGRFTSALTRTTGTAIDLEHRPIQSVDRTKELPRVYKGGARLDSYMQTLNPWTRLPDDLEEEILGKVILTKLNVAVGSELTASPTDVPVTGEAMFVSEENENGVLTLNGKVRVSGSLRLKWDGSSIVIDPSTDVTLNVIGVVSGDIKDPVTERITSRLIAYLEEAGVTVKVDSFGPVHDAPVGDGEPSISPPSAGKYEVTVAKDQVGVASTTPAYAITAKRALPITSMADFTPDGIAKNVPKLHRLRVIRESVLELQSSLRNNPELRKAMKSILPDTEEKPEVAKPKIERLQRFQEWAIANFSECKIERLDAPKDAKPFDEQDKPAITPVLASVHGDLKALTNPTPLIKYDVSGFKFLDRDTSVRDSARIINAFATLLVNTDPIDATAINVAKPYDKEHPLPTFPVLIDRIAKVTKRADAEVRKQLNAIMHNPGKGNDYEFRKLEANWRGLEDLVESVTSDDVIIDFLDITKDELKSDMVDNAADIFGSALFEKVYVDEYDRYGGRPFSTMIGLYEYGSEEEDVTFFRALMRVCASAHCPFVSSASHAFFGADQKGMAAVATVTDLDAIMNDPQRAAWKALRDEEYAAYVGLTLPRYLVRRPWDARDAGEGGQPDNLIGFVEAWSVAGAKPDDQIDNAQGDDDGTEDKDNGFLWGNAAVLFAKNVVRSYEQSGWAQNIRGPLGGGVVNGLTAYTYPRVDGSEVLFNPVEIAIPDYREYEFARNGLIPLVQTKGEAKATFFSAQSIKSPRDWAEEVNTQNAYLVTNLAYTYSITAIAHYVKATMREYIGSTADGAYIQLTLSNWLSGFVTTVVNPDDLTLLYYPFRATSVEVKPKPGPLGWYSAIISVLPHIQFEGMDVELRLEASLGGKA